MNYFQEKDTWFREEYRDRLDELESRSEYEKRNGLRDGVIGTRIREYTDLATSICPVVYERWRSGGQPEKIFVTAELDKFLESARGHDAPRTPVQVKWAEVIRRREAVAKYTSYRDNKKAALEKSERTLKHHVTKLKQAEQDYEVEKRLAEDQ